MSKKAGRQRAALGVKAHSVGVYHLLFQSLVVSGGAAGGCFPPWLGRMAV